MYISYVYTAILIQICNLVQLIILPSAISTYIDLCNLLYHKQDKSINIINSEVPMLLIEIEFCSIILRHGLLMKKKALVNHICQDKENNCHLPQGASISLISYNIAYLHKNQPKAFDQLQLDSECSCICLFGQ